MPTGVMREYGWLVMEDYLKDIGMISLKRA
jgi:hypothetical protein